MARLRLQASYTRGEGIIEGNERSSAATLSVFGLFAMGFGQIVGVGWIIIMGDWLRAAGPGGTVAMLLFGGLALLSVGACYGWIAARIRQPGAEIAYAYNVFGPRAAFIVGWFLALFAISIVSFLTISFGWIVSKLLNLPEGRALYQVFGEPIYVSQFAISFAGLFIVGLMNYLGIKSAGRFQSAATALLIFAALIMIVSGTVLGESSNFYPLFASSSGEPLIGGLVSVFVTVPFFFAGFQIIPQLVEHAPQHTRISSAALIAVSLIGAGLFYSGITVAVSLVAPWQDIVDADLPVHYAFSSATLGAVLGPAVLLAGSLGILTTWNSAFVWALKILSALGRAGFIPAGFATPAQRRRGSALGVALISGCGLFALFLGRSFILPIVNFAAAAIVIGMLCTTLCVLRLYPRDTGRDLPGGALTLGLGIVTSFVMLALALYEPWRTADGQLPAETIVFVIWTTLGTAFWLTKGPTRGDALLEEDKLVESP